MAARLEPAVELAVMNQQEAIAGGGGDPGRGGDVAGAAGAVEGNGVGEDELTDARGHRGVAGMAGVVAIEQVKERSAVHPNSPFTIPRWHIDSSPTRPFAHAAIPLAAWSPPRR